jgi:hypothetical protein
MLLLSRRVRLVPWPSTKMHETRSTGYGGFGCCQGIFPSFVIF